jgi:hypothetical protein
MPAAAVSDLSTTARPRRALAAAPTGAPEPVAPISPTTSITVTVTVDLRDEQLPPAVLGLLESVRALAGPAAVTVSGPGHLSPGHPGPGRSDAGCPDAGRSGAQACDAGAGARIVGADDTRPTGGRAAEAPGRPPAPGAIRLVDGRALDGRALDGRSVDGRSVDGRSVDGRSLDGRSVDGRSPDGRGLDGRGLDGRGLDGRSVDLADGWAARPRPRLLRTGAETAPGAPALRIYVASRMVVRAGVPIRLTRREYDLLTFLCEHPRRVFTRRQLMRQVWGHEMIGGERTVDVHVRRLRVKLAEPGPLIATVRGVGYRLDEATQVAIVADPQ